MSSCVNHAHRGAAGRCIGCNLLFCDPCCGFLINEAPWCEPCGRGQLDLGRGNRPLGLIVAVVALVLWIALIYRFHVMGSGLVAAVVGLGIPLGFGWRIAYPPLAGTRPRIVDRSEQRVRLPPL
jgi:hypothetical protein